MSPGAGRCASCRPMTAPDSDLRLLCRGGDPRPVCWSAASRARSPSLPTSTASVRDGRRGADPWLCPEDPPRRTRPGRIAADRRSTIGRQSRRCAAASSMSCSSSALSEELIAAATATSTICRRPRANLVHQLLHPARRSPRGARAEEAAAGLLAPEMVHASPPRPSPR